MSHFANPSRVLKFRIFLIIGFSLLLIYHLYLLATGQSDRYLPLFTPVLFIVLLSYQISKRAHKGASSTESSSEFIK
jgi:hypothetical protein